MDQGEGAHLPIGIQTRYLQRWEPLAPARHTLPVRLTNYFRDIHALAAHGIPTEGPLPGIARAGRPARRDSGRSQLADAGPGDSVFLPGVNGGAHRRGVQQAAT